MTGPVPPAGPIVVVGLMGSGKTTVARLLAQALSRPLRDSDEELELRYGQTAADQVGALGVSVLHEREARHLREALADERRPVIAAAASVIEEPACRAALGQAFVVWLHAPAEVLADRMRAGDHRPHFDPDLTRMLAEQHQRRAPYFRDVADVAVDVSGPGPIEVAEQVLATLTYRADLGEIRPGLPDSRPGFP